MAQNRRSFLGNLALGAGVLAAAPMAACSGVKDESKFPHMRCELAFHPGSCRNRSR